MLNNFYTDLTIGKRAEKVALEVLSQLNSSYTFEDVSNERDCWYKGDIKVTNKDGVSRYIEVKNDSRIGDTHNVLCEEYVYYKTTGEMGKGNMFCDSDYYCIVSEPEHKIYLMDFHKLKEIYKRGEYKEIHHAQQDTICRLLPLSVVEKAGALMDTIEYTEEVA